MRTKIKKVKKDFGLEIRLADLQSQKIRVFHNPLFDIPSKKNEILGDMPDISQFFKNCKRTSDLLHHTEIAPEMRPCYESPLLTREQEFHLFRKMNYYKYRALKLMGKVKVHPDQSVELVSKVKPALVGPARVEKIERFLSLARDMRNQIASSNFRLATQLLRNHSSVYKNHSLTDSLMSDAYFDVLKAVDYFNYNLGNKFSTYATWVLRKNYSRDAITQTKFFDRHTTGMEDHLNEISDDFDGDEQATKHRDNKQLVNKLLSLLKESDCNGDVNRQIFAIQEWFGLKGEHRTLENISAEMGVTKERVRQLKNRGLEKIREQAKKMGINFEGN